MMLSVLRLFLTSLCRCSKSRELRIFYDYLEIQPVANNHFMVESERYEDINSDDDIRRDKQEIVRLGEQFNKPVVATCDAHFLNPEDEIYRTIIMAGKGMNDEEPAPLFLRTTDEMMAEV